MDDEQSVEDQRAKHVARRLTLFQLVVTALEPLEENERASLIHAVQVFFDLA